MMTHNFDAVIFDLDGVITKTAIVHSNAWKQMFNDYLRFREKEYGENHRDFTHEDDYLPHVDGKPRYKGVNDFLKSRNIDIPFGDPSDKAEEETVCGLGNRKNNYFTDILNKDGVQVYESTVAFIEDLKKEGIRLGVASSSKNCKMVLETADLLHYFETRVDGVVSAEIGLKGKPEPDIFTTACDNLGVAYDRTVVVEDAVSGVQAGARGGFGLTLGLAREENEEALSKNGADLVLRDISELGGIEAVDNWFSHRVEELKWNLNYTNYESEKEKSREALLATGNGFFATRGSMEEVNAGENNYPGSYMAGLFNRRKTKVGDRWIENEDFVNFINWLPVNFRYEGGEWFDPNKNDFYLLERRLDLKTGVLYRSLLVKHTDGKETQVDSRRFVSMANPHVAGLEYSVTPLNYSGEIELFSGLDGDLINDGVERYRDLDQNHLDQVDQGRSEGTGYVIVRTNQSDVSVSVAEQLSVIKAGEEIDMADFQVEKGKIKSYFRLKAEEGESVCLQKRVVIKNSRDFETMNPLGESLDEVSKLASFDDLVTENNKAWKAIWEKSDIEVSGDRYSQMLLRLHIFHLYTTASPHHSSLDFGIPARGLHGEAYRGHIFWDELYVLPFYISRFPEIARSVLMYRYRRLDKAREYAASHGYEGAMFPWQSGSDGREETQILHLNPVSGKWGDDYSSLQRHISIAIAYNVWEYYHISGDQDFMDSYGAEMFFEICRFWASKCELDTETGRYSIDKVMGPDEFHEKLPGSETGGLKDNSYTNLMVVWCMNRAFNILDQLSIEERQRVVSKIDLRKEELVKWKDVSLKMNVLINDNAVMEQYEGYFGLSELDMEAYKNKYGNIHRMDRILKAEGKSPDEYKVAKQADTLMLYYNLDHEEVERMLFELGYPAPEDMLKRNFDYYLQRTSHGSTLSRVVHAYLAKLTGDTQYCRDLYLDALASDYNDIQGGTTGEGIHVGVMGGTVLSALTVFAGLNWRGEGLRLDPELPAGWREMKFSFQFRKAMYKVTVNKDEVKITYFSGHNSEASVFVGGEKYFLKNNEELIAKL